MGATARSRRHMVNLNQIVAVVDDDESVCRAIKRLLHSVGIAAETFSSGGEFLDTLAAIPSYRPACVILDVQMPGISGLEVQRQLAPTGLPVIVITAHDELSTRQTALASGAVAYLRKPLNGAILIKAVEMAIGGTLRP
ncbi:Response regulator protein TmoT [Paraburkholderia saeva]|uniref:Response regulator protein TmoT n=2 Tax=Paraburkholderia saeva TaxID=2777537 RepID=A0A9N8RXZ1_9BURK|nr:Response regulator protein TmoT [Paraburkholderia saeva]CAG4895145.1 Response regulator protein TmoT [Paraburkholderia saeva]CAG4904537.1 Response regulator protein TmoT [Paraburkholderia saeva]